MLLRVEGFDRVESVEAVEVAERESLRGCVGAEMGERWWFSSLIGAYLMASSSSESMRFSCFHGFPPKTSCGIEFSRDLGILGVAGLTSNSGICSDVDGDTAVYTLVCGMYAGSGADDGNDGVLPRPGRGWNKSPILLTTEPKPDDRLRGFGLEVPYSLDVPSVSVGEAQTSSGRIWPRE